MSRFDGLCHLRGISATVEEVRRLAGLSLRQMAAAMHRPWSRVHKLEKKKGGDWRRAGESAWVLYVSYFAVDPVNGWLRAALGLPPTGDLPPEVAQQLAHLRSQYGKRPRKQRSKSGSTGIARTSKPDRQELPPGLPDGELRSPTTDPIEPPKWEWDWRPGYLRTATTPTDPTEPS